MGAGDQAASRASSEANQRLEGCKADMAGKRVGLPGDRGCQIPRIWILRIAAFRVRMGRRRAYGIFSRVHADGQQRCLAQVSFLGAKSVKRCRGARAVVG